MAKNVMKQKKRTSLFLSIAMLLFFAVGGTLAYLMVSTAAVQNRFAPAEVTCETQADGKVTNTGDVDAYIRAAVVVNWMDADGNVYGIKPNATFTAPDSSKWKAIGEFYYYTEDVAPAAATATAPVAVTVTESAPAGYSLNVEYVAEAIQAEGATDDGDVPAITDAWGVDPTTWTEVQP